MSEQSAQSDGTTTTRQDGVTKAIKMVRELMKISPQPVSTRNDDTYILWFLQASKYNHIKAYRMLRRYTEYQQHNPKLFKNFNVTDAGVRSSLLDGLPGVLVHKDKYNRRVLVLFASNWDQRLYGLVSIYRAILLSLMKLLEEEEDLCLNGVVLIVDWCQFTFKQSTGVQPHVLRLIIEGLQDCFPVNIEEVHFLNQPWYVEAMFKITKTFMSPENRNKVHLHGNNMATLHRRVNEDILPAEFGGSGPPYHMHSWATHMLSLQQTTEVPSTVYWPSHLNTIKRRSETFPLDHFTSEVDLKKRGSVHESQFNSDLFSKD